MTSQDTSQIQEPFLKLFYITNDVEIAKIADNSGVDAVFIDLEYKGKEARQKGLDSVKSSHKISDIKKIKPVLKNAELLVRINPLDNESEHEIDQVIDSGADIVMLPMFKTAREVKEFVHYVDGRAKVMLLLEHIDAVNCLDDILESKGIDFIHIGLNDLSISQGMKFMFEPMANGQVEKICGKIKKAGIPFGIGGIGRLYSDNVAVSTELIVAEHYRLGSRAAILSRSFCSHSNTELSKVEEDFITGVTQLRQFEKELQMKDNSYFETNHTRLKEEINKVNIKNKKA